MKIKYFIFSLLYFGMCTAQETIHIPHKKANEVTWTGPEKAYYSTIWQTNVVTNVSVPTMQIYRPKNPNGTAVIIAPGGGLYALSINSEGNDVAKWLSENGITAFVLKYRLVPTAEDGVAELNDDGANNIERLRERVTPVLPHSINDGLAAIQYVRENSKTLQIEKDKIGFMGFSAGGAVTMGVAYNFTTTNKPNFIVPVYPWTTALPVQKAPENAPKMLVICATDDPLGLATGSIELYTSWQKAGLTPELHMYAKGGHGFGMKKQNLPSDTWIQRFYDWSVSEGITTPN